MNRHAFLTQPALEKELNDAARAACVRPASREDRCTARRRAVACIPEATPCVARGGGVGYAAPGATTCRRLTTEATGDLADGVAGSPGTRRRAAAEESTTDESAIA